MPRMSPPPALAKRLGTARRARNLSQTQLAELMGPTHDQTLVSHVETGQSSILNNGLIAAATAREVSTDYLLGLTDDPSPRPAPGSDPPHHPARPATSSYPR